MYTLKQTGVVLIVLVLMCVYSVSVLAATNATVTTAPTFDLYKGNSLVSPRVTRPTFSECMEAARLLNKGDGCQSRNGKFKLVTVVDPLPPPPVTPPLVQAGDITYLGAFAIPNSEGEPRAGFGGQGLAVETERLTGRKLLIFQGNGGGWFAKVEIPQTFVKSDNYGSLPMAKFVAPFSYLIGDKIGTLGDIYNGWRLGTLVWNDRLIIGANLYYAEDRYQTASHGARSLNLSTDDFTGFIPLGTQLNNYSATFQRAMGGYMTPIPQEWRTSFGGPVIGGACCGAVISSTSAGPSASVFDPGTIGSVTQMTGTTVVAYPIGTAVCSMVSISADCMNSGSNPVFNLTTSIVGIAFPQGTRSVLFFGRHGMGEYCYNNPGIICNDPEGQEKGTHAYPYRFQVWAYDANDLLRVKRGEKKPNEVFPYAYWELPDLRQLIPSDRTTVLVGATFDPDTGRLYAAIAYGESPRIEVFQISQPTNLTIR